MKKPRFIGLICLAMLLIPYFITNRFFMLLLTTSMISIILITGLNLLVGLTGQVSLGHAAFYGLGAYGSAILAVDFNLPFAVTALAGILLATVIGALIGFPATRLKGPYLAMTTLGFGQIFQLLAVNLIGITKGPLGVTGIKPASLFGYTFNSVYSNYALVFVCLLLSILVFYRLKNGPVGRAWMAIRDSEIAADAMGINITYYNVLAFAICSAYAGLAGVLWAHYTQYISPDQFPFASSFTMISMLVIGGRGTILGTIIGASMLTFLPEYMRPLKDWRYVIYAVILIGIVIYAPGGLVEIFQKIKRFIAVKVFKINQAVDQEGR